MVREVKIEEVSSIDGHLEGLAELLILGVGDGASIGFLPPLPVTEAKSYWENVLAPDVLLYVAKQKGQIVGTVQLHLCTKPNGVHRAEIAKLITHPNFRRQGIGRLLMQTVEERAKLEGRSLVVLDTREGDPSNLLYRSIGFTQAGRIPHFAQSATGELHATILYYKTL